MQKEHVVQQAHAANQTDAAAIHNLFQQLLDDWGRGDGRAYGSRFTEDADYVAFDGSHTRGREQVAAAHQQLFESWLKGTRLTGRIEHIRFLNISGQFARSGRSLLNGPPQQWAEELAGIALEYGVTGFILAADDAPSSELFAAEVAPATRELVAAERARRSMRM